MFISTKSHFFLSLLFNCKNYECPTTSITSTELSPCPSKDHSPYKFVHSAKQGSNFYFYFIFLFLSFFFKFRYSYNTNHSQIITGLYVWEKERKRERDGKRKETMRDYWSRHWINSSSFSKPHQIVLVYFFLQAVFVSYIFLMEVTIFLQEVMASFDC